MGSIVLLVLLGQARPGEGVSSNKNIWCLSKKYYLYWMTTRIHNWSIGSSFFSAIWYFIQHQYLKQKFSFSSHIFLHFRVSGVAGWPGRGPVLWLRHRHRQPLVRGGGRARAPVPLAGRREQGGGGRDRHQWRVQGDQSYQTQDWNIKYLQSYNRFRPLPNWFRNAYLVKRGCYL